MIIVQQGIPAYRGMRSRYWPQVDGRITVARLELDSDLGARGMTAFSPDVRFEYAVDNRRYEGNTVLYGGFTRAWSDRLLAKLRSGETVRVSYDPSDPSHAVLQPGVHVAQIIYTAVGLAIFAYGAQMLWQALR
jgi:hypothetical protein